MRLYEACNSNSVRGHCQTTRPVALAHPAQKETPGTVPTLAGCADTEDNKMTLRLTWLSLLLGVSYSAVR